MNERNVQFTAVQNLGQQGGLETDVDYQNALEKVVTIFSSQPDTPAFDELMALLSQIRNYENHKLVFPPVKACEIIKDRMDMFGLPADYLAKTISSEDKVQLFLSGKLELSAKKLEQIFKRFHIKFPVGDL
ncbi:MAG: hypothetical protein EOP45_00775 [Sphingobacteriaceae bacterium]|nr:MAG: hypothetical protein EOP45_00775 [Sphingobacteriaceae bacterium]